jgi:6-phospho-beta-glucosidase
VIERLTILGGSSVYTPEFILSAISHNLNVKEIVLVGREGPKLPIVGKFCQRMLDKSGFPATIVCSTDTNEAVRGAQYIVNGIRVGGLKARARDEKAPVRFGMIGDESLGAGGFANAMRTLPVVFHIAEQIERVNPNAVFINLTNPMGVIVEALTRYSKLNVIGTCDLPGTCVRKLAEVLNCLPSELNVDYIGLNHFGWIQDVKVDGRSCMPCVLDRLERYKEDGFDHGLIELFRMIPVRTVSLHFRQDDILKKQRTDSRCRSEILHEAEEQILELYQDEHLAEIPDLTRERNAVWYDQTIVPLIEALESRNEHTHILCVRNNDSIRDLPEEASVEIPVGVSKKGLHRHAVGSCPRFLKGLFVSIKESDRLVIEAARHKSYECALQSLTINPLVTSLRAARKFLEYLIKEENLELH